LNEGTGFSGVKRGPGPDLQEVKGKRRRGKGKRDRSETGEKLKMTYPYFFLRGVQATFWVKTRRGRNCKQTCGEENSLKYGEKRYNTQEGLPLTGSRACHRKGSKLSLQKGRRKEKNKIHQFP